MELIKKNIHMNKIKCKSALQLTLDDDFNVPDIKPDIDRIITQQGEVKISEIKSMNEKLLVKGELSFNVLYFSEEDARPIHNIAGEIPFDEIINMELTCAGDNPIVKWELEDLNTGLINSRKLSVKSVISLNVVVEELYDEETGVMVEGPEDIQYISKSIEITDISIDKNDTFRIKDEIMLPTNKGNVLSVLYDSISLSNMEVRLLEDKFTIKGDLPVFILYACEREERPFEYYETDLSFGGTVDCNGCNEDMVEDITFRILSKNIEIKPDTDGEDRLVDLEVILEMAIKVYEMQDTEILCDVYSPCKDISPIMREATYENLVVKNNSKYRVADRIRLGDNQPSILQICHSEAAIKIDDVIPNDTELQVEGIIDMNILYISEDDSRPLSSLKGAIPFTQLVEVKGMNSSSSFDIRPSIDQLSVMMLDGQEIEVKAVMNLNTIVFDRITESVITDIEVTDLDLDKLQAMPGIIGYVVKKNDSLWNIAKKYYTTVDTIMEINNMEDSSIKEGDKLIIMKKVEPAI